MFKMSLLRVFIFLLVCVVVSSGLLSNHHHKTHHATVHTTVKQPITPKNTRSTTPAPTRSTTPQAKHACICNTNHPQLDIFQCPNRTSQIIGFLYLQDTSYSMDLSSTHCKEIASFVLSPDGWFPVLHFGQVGYIRQDTGTSVQKCPGATTSSKGFTAKPCQSFFFLSSSPVPSSTSAHHAPSTTPKLLTTTTTTKRHTSVSTTMKTPAMSTTTTKRPPTSTTAKQHTTSTKGSTSSTVDHVCNSLETVLELGKHEPVYHGHARQCPSGDSRNEAVVMKFCFAPEPSSWIQGRRVLDHCSDIPPYTPINMYGFGTNMLISGIFIKCTNATEFSIIHQQDCSGGLHLESINVLAGSGMFYVIHW
ncbi:mucin-2-like [Saccostrea cucullata]|uniref:mucin-2-like n=1 Tax=Saccostrea cuccullata TaxID=36930 RepID=UPI002ED2DDAA